MKSFDPGSMHISLAPRFNEAGVYRSADLQSAVSPICNRHDANPSRDARLGRWTAGCKPEIRQTTSLPYWRRQHRKQKSTEVKSLGVVRKPLKRFARCIVASTRLKPGANE